MFHNHDSILVQEYASLGAPYLAAVPATPLRTPPSLLHLNTELASEIGLNVEQLSSTQGIDALSGNTPFPGYQSQASVYCGHQFGQFVPQLGDGRALLIAEIRKGKQYRQLQLKGAGPTPYSRHADGRAVLRSSIREYLASEAMHALGIPTTRALSLTASADPVFRETTETAAIVCRVSESFMRFGHVEFFCYTNQLDALRNLLTWHIEQHHPEIDLGESEESFHKGLLAWLKIVVERTARMVAQWQAVGFCHGVMNTDNMSLLGLTIDYGPYGFIDGFDIDHICNHSDHQGRYSYRNQPRIAHWNLYALAQALSPLIPDSKENLQNLLDGFADVFHTEHSALFARKLGLSVEQGESADTLIENTLKFMHEHKLDFTRFFRSLAALNPQASAADNFAAWQKSTFFPLALGDEDQVNNAKLWLNEWLLQVNKQVEVSAWQAQLNLVNPAFILRNHLLQNAIEQSQQGDFTEVNRLFAALSDPYSAAQLPAEYTAEPPDWAKTLVLSCSS
ncbi:protein adenylyltransferase SelO [Limnobacter parvus]|uniref:Protein nucleotidyltransferase YdiU n=1 Tax=Limnobacter parvus TaxID=2939690 RepID=A0ABT1XKX3_9BURK|nr:YdiU family protein [Limnobacter parvus]MCR2746927.1 YdiU family protein [Limnobacter parvus]